MKYFLKEHEHDIINKNNPLERTLFHCTVPSLDVSQKNMVYSVAVLGTNN